MKWLARYSMAFVAFVVVLFASIVPLCASEADDKIESLFKKTYVYNTYLKDDSISIDSKDGVVTLTGTVAEETHKVLAGETVARLSGVLRVDNKLETKAEVAAESVDRWIGRKAMLVLLFYRNVSVSKTSVEVKDGVVTLKGEAANVAQKELTAEYIKGIDGVKEVKNEMTIAKVPVVQERTAGEKIDDASVTAQVKAALLIHSSTKSIVIGVETRNGEVTLTGIAKNDAEKALATKVATDIQGVTSVDNQMTVGAVKK